MSMIDILQINITKENCDYYFEITTGVEHINMWLRKKNTFDYWKASYANEETNISFDQAEKYIKTNFDRLVEELTGEKVPEGEINSENIFAGFQWVGEDGLYAEILKEYTVCGYIFCPWMCKEGTDTRVYSGWGDDFKCASELKEWEIEIMKEEYFKHNPEKKQILS